MRITVSTTIDTQPWSLAVRNAPAEILEKAKAMAENGIPAVMGIRADNGNWVVVSYHFNQPMITKEVEPIVPSIPVDMPDPSKVATSTVPSSEKSVSP